MTLVDESAGRAITATEEIEMATKRVPAEPVEEFELVTSSEETTVTINTLVYSIPRNEEVVVPSAVADILREGGFVAPEAE